MFPVMFFLSVSLLPVFRYVISAAPLQKFIFFGKDAVLRVKAYLIPLFLPLYILIFVTQIIEFTLESKVSRWRNRGCGRSFRLLIFRGIRIFHLFFW